MTKDIGLGIPEELVYLHKFLHLVLEFQIIWENRDIFLIPNLNFISISSSELLSPLLPEFPLLPEHSLR